MYRPFVLFVVLCSASHASSENRKPPLSVDANAAMIVHRAYDAAAKGDRPTFDRLTHGAKLITSGSGSRLLRMSDLKPPPRCAIREFVGRSAHDVVVVGGCVDARYPQHGWPYESQVQLKGGRITAVRPIAFEW
jgi:hypothetical protein